MRRSTAKALNLNVMGRLVSVAYVGVEPRIMGIGPVKAIPMAVGRAGLAMDDIAVFEINEAFASQCVYCIRTLNLKTERVNPNGGAIALGHPLGCTGRVWLSRYCMI